MNYLSANTLNTILQHCYRLPLHVQDRCDVYYLLHWNGNHLARRLTDDKQFIERDGVLFEVSWYNKEPIEDYLSAPRVAVSFRKAANESIGWAIVKILYGATALDSGGV